MAKRDHGQKRDICDSISPILKTVGLFWNSRMYVEAWRGPGLQDTLISGNSLFLAISAIVFSVRTQSWNLFRICAQRNIKTYSEDGEIIKKNITLGFRELLINWWIYVLAWEWQIGEKPGFRESWIPYHFGHCVPGSHSRQHQNLSQR